MLWFGRTVPLFPLFFPSFGEKKEKNEKTEKLSQGWCGPEVVSFLSLPYGLLHPMSFLSPPPQ